MASKLVDPVSDFHYKGSLLRYSTVHIRLLALLPSQHSSDSIYCTLSEQPLDDTCPPYETLSYVWGSAVDLREISCDNECLKITENLFEALRALRDQRQPRVLWIDQICINQKDDLEKTAQVTQMRQVYAKSRQTVAWLGSSLSSSALAFDALHRLAEGWLHPHPLNSSNDGVDTAGEVQSHAEPGDHLLSLLRDAQTVWGVSKPTQDEIRAIRMLLRNPWFTRIWIVQEAVVSKRLSMQCGSDTISFDKLLGGMLIMWSLAIEPGPTARYIKGQDNLEILSGVRHAYFVNNSKNRSLLQLLSMCHTFKATDQRDRFYALYGLSASPCSLLGLKPDYTVDPHIALARAMYSVCKHERNLQLLELTESCDDTRLPSWIPSARGDDAPRIYPCSLLHEIRETIEDGMVALMKQFSNGNSDGNGFEIDWGIPPDVDEENPSSEEETTILEIPLSLKDDRVLCVSGQLLDRIHELGPVLLFPAALEYGFGSFSQTSNVFEDLENIASEDDVNSYFDVAKFTVVGTKLVGRACQRILSEWTAFITAWAETDAMVTNRPLSARLPSSEAVLGAYRRTILAGQSWSNSGLEAEESVVKSFNEWRDTISLAVKMVKLKRRLPFGSFWDGAALVATSVRGHISDRFSSRFMRGLMSPIYGRRMAWTTKGNLALVPAKAQTGDQLFHLQGGHLPFILRLEQGGHRLIGPTYYEGFADDRALSTAEFHPLELV